MLFIAFIHLIVESLLHKAFEEFGEIKEVRIFRDKGFSFIR